MIDKIEPKRSTAWAVGGWYMIACSTFVTIKLIVGIVGGLW